MTIVRIGATQKYADGWEKAFGRSNKKSASTKSTKPGKVAAAKARSAKKKPAAKKKARRS